MALELKTTRGADDALTTTTPGAPGGHGAGLLGGDIGGLLQKILKRRLEDQLYDLNSRGTPISGTRVGSPAASAAAPRQYAPSSVSRETPSRTPSSGGSGSLWGASAPRPITRGVMHPTQNNWQQERLLPNGKWEFDDLRQTAPTANIYGAGSGLNAGIPGVAAAAPADDPRMRSLVAAQAAAKRD